MPAQFNPQDPLLKSGPPTERGLFDLFVKSADGYPIDMIIGASINMLVNAVRQTYGSRTQAHKRTDEIAAKIHELLDKHYDPVTDRRRSIFPFTQYLKPELFVDPDMHQGRK